MFHRLAILICLFLCINSSVAKGSTKYENNKHKRFYYACNYQTRKEVTFCSMMDKACPCKNQNQLATIAGCMDILNKTSERYLEPWVESCSYSNVTLEGDWFEQALDYYKSNAKAVSEIPNFNISVPIETPFILNRTRIDVYQESYRRFYNNLYDSIDYGAGLLGYWLLVLLLGAIFNWTKFLFPGLTKKMTNPVINFWRANVSLPATFKIKKSQEQQFLRVFSFLIPSRFESLVIFLFYCVTIWLNAMNLKAPKEEAMFESTYKAEIRYVGDRTGITATMMMPLVFLYAGRNNFLQWLVGWNYSTFVMYHRHTARVMFMLVVIHAVCYTIAFGSNYSSRVKYLYLKWGIAATVCGGLIMIQGMLYLRRRWYEVFLILHILLAVFWTIGAWYHVIDLGYIWLVYPAVAVWCFDRAVRIGRLISFGFPHADVTLLSDETLKVVIPKPSYWKSIPGGHAFIHFLKPTYFWQSHPFTFTDSVENNHSIVLYCKVKGGVTHSLYQSLAQAPGRTCKIRVSVEGPYGEATAAKYADTAVFMAGGNGIPGIYSEVVDIAKKTKGAQNKLKLQWVVREWRSLYWFYEELLNLRDTKIETTVYITQPSCHVFIDEFNNRFQGLERLEIEESETSNSEKECSINEIVKVEDNSSDEKQDSIKDITKIDDSSCEEKATSNRIIDVVKKELSHVTFKEGRPSIKDIVPQEIHESNGSVAFVTCGHSIMVDEIRYYCAKNVSNSEKKRVDFYEQIQVWA
ncbi:hypothetical protein CANMA_002058 [Candida margitis]|uniref:uncharacterized protein n=1 Tax=Candida margitis TaxID=1775924 RepID=UPI0022272067|nr:uncharacterized protein CANMA_002058 [Candida margitis]KAI5968884.1 hypothetical protein CANMA_002058 [Candida margitis]